MIDLGGMSGELSDLGKAIGIIHSSGGSDAFNANWLSNPLDSLETILSNEEQRDALLRLLDALLPPESVPGAAAGVKWHPLLGQQPNGNVYLTVEETSTGVRVGVAASYGSSPAPGIQGRIRAQIPLVDAGATVTAIAGTEGGPLSVELRVELGLTRDPDAIPPRPIGLDAVVLRANLAPPDFSLQVILEKLALDDSPAADKVLEPDNLGREVPDLLAGLLKQVLALVTPSPTVTLLANHLLGLFGLAESEIPALPFADLADGPSALRGWLDSLLVAGSSTAPVKDWLEHLAGLFNNTITALGTGTQADPWRVRLIPFSSTSGLWITVARIDGVARFGVAAKVQGGTTHVIGVEAAAAIVDVPLGGAASARPLPSAHVLLQLTGSSGARLAQDSGGSFWVGSLNAGVDWDGTELKPTLELVDVRFQNTPYARLDLTSVDSVVGAAASTVLTTITNALGSDVGRHIAALAGLGLVTDPADPTRTLSTWPHQISAAQLVTDPAGAIRAFHRAVLLDTTFGWDCLLRELAAILNITSAIDGHGTRTDPWRVTLVGGSSGPALQLAAWNDQPGGVEPLKLRLGLRAAFGVAPVQLSWLAELLAFDLPASGAGSVALVGTQRLRLQLAPAFDGPLFGDITAHVSSVAAEAVWTPGSPLAWQASATGVQLNAPEGNILVSALAFPPAGGFDISSPATTAAAFGISVHDLERLICLLLSQLAQGAGPQAYVAAACLGLHHHLPGLSEDAPTLANPADAGRLLSDPLEAWRRWIARAVAHVGSDGAPHLPHLLAWLQALVDDELPKKLEEGPAPDDGIVEGAGVFDDPWTLTWPGARRGGPELHLWLEPAGPPSAWASGWATRLAACEDFDQLADILVSLSAESSNLWAVLAERTRESVAAALQTLAVHFSSSDGVVPLSSQAPEIFGWDPGTTLAAAHHRLPQDPDAITQILARIDQWAGGTSGARVVLLLGPSFGSAADWAPLLASPARHGTISTGAHFNLRVPDVDPLTVALDDVTAAVDYYTADLADDGSGNLSSLTGQIERLAARLEVLRPGQPITLVAHSTAGIAARAYTAAHASRVRGLITLGTPHLGAPLPFLANGDVGDAVRIAQALRPGMPASALRDALDHVLLAMEGYLPEAAPGLLPKQQPYPIASFLMVAPLNTGTVPVLALGGVLVDPLLDVLASAARVVALTVAGTTNTPTHLAGGVGLRMDLPEPRSGEVEVEALLRAGLFQLPLQFAAPALARPRHLIRVEAHLGRKDGWLLGGPSTFPLGLPSDNPLSAFVDIRARRLTFGIDLVPGSGPLTATPWFRVLQGAARGRTQNILGAADALGQQVFGEAMRSLASATAAAGAAAAQLMDALRAIGLAVEDASGDLGFSADGWAALQIDAVALLRARLPAALARAGGWLGITGPEAGLWRWRPLDSPLELSIARQGLYGPWSLSIGLVEEVGEDENAPLLRVGVELTTPLPALAPTVELEVSVGLVELHYRPGAGTLTIEASPWLDELTLLPAPSATVLGERLNEALPRLLFSGALSAVLSTFAPGVRASALERFLRSTGEFLQSASAFGRADGPGFDGDKVQRLLVAINQLASFPSGPGLQLPGGLTLTAGGEGTPEDPLRLTLATTSPIEGVLSVSLGLHIDHLRHVTPAGTVGITTPLTGTWPQVTIEFGVDEHGVSLAVEPQGQPAIQILPAFSGLGALRGTAEALLPQVLDAIVAEIGTPPAWLTSLLNAATALGIYDSTGHFAAHAGELRSLVTGSWSLDTPHKGSLIAAVGSLLGGVGLPGTIAAIGSMVTWSTTLEGHSERRIGFSAGWLGDDPQVRVFAENVQFGTAPVRASLGISVGTAGLECDGGLAVALDSIGVPLAPKLAFELNTSPLHFELRVLPLAGTSDDGPLEIVLAPEPAIHASGNTAERIIVDWAVPLVARTLIEAVRDELSRHLWTGGPTLQDALHSAGLLDGGGSMVTTLPPIFDMVSGLLQGLATGVAIPIGHLTLGLISSGGRIGLQLKGYQEFAAGDFELSIRFGAPQSWTQVEGSDNGTSGADGGLELFLLRTGSGSFELDVGLLIAGLGFGIGKPDDAPLLDGVVRIGAARVYLFMDIETSPGLSVDNFGAGAELLGFGLPLGAATSGNLGGNNPVASNLMRSDGAGGDNRPVNPGVDIDVWYWQPPGGTGEPFHIRFGGQTGALWIGIHAGFGPVYIDQIGLTANSNAASLLIDGGISVAGLSAQVDDLTVRIPFRNLGDPSQWSLDLKGLAVGYTAPGVAISGGLIKFDGPPIEYDGMLLIKLGTIGAVVVGSYAVVKTGADEYTSIAIFGGVFVPIGIPPIINITGLGLGLGYNRQLIVPEDLNQIPDFMLVKALDRPEDLANDPMRALLSFRDQVPPKRGSLWLAAGLRGTAFEIVHITAVLYVALDNGVEVGLLGVARMALPTDDTALVSVELALKARYSSSEGLFSIQAQLTDNSWLLSRDCQLTGGFAFFMWFRESQFLLTLGGYHPAFQRRPEYPVVPRLGYHWNFLGVVHIKGESYFALTNTCVMAGARMEVTYGPDWLQLWFTAYADFLASWEPFHYDARVGVSIGARLRIEVCFIKCVHITISVSVGADLHLEGPPLHGTVTVDLAVTTVTVEFGDPAAARPPPLSWDQFAQKYLQGSDPATLPVGVQVTSGLQPPEPPGAAIAPGTEEQPWRMTAEWSFQTETRMPARGFAFQTSFLRSESQIPTSVFGKYDNLARVYEFDLAPMYLGADHVRSLHRVTFYKRPEGGGDWVALVPRGSPEMPDDAAFILDERLFRVEPIIGQVSEAAYHYFSDLKPPAAANTLPALTGLKLEGIAGLHNPSAVIPIAKLRDASNPRPLPFAKPAPELIEDWKLAGKAAGYFLDLAEGYTPRKLIDAYAKILSGGGGDDPFGDLRQASGMSRQGLSPLATRTLRDRRSSPPLLSTLSLGLSMESVAQALPPQTGAVKPQAPVPLRAPRLRAVLQQRLTPTVAGLPVFRTTVTRTTLDTAARVVNVDRELARQVTVAGARLLIQRPLAAPRATRLPRTFRSVRSPELGAAVGRSTAVAMARLQEQALGNGVRVRSAVTHVWEVPPGPGRRLFVTGEMALRITLLGRGGAVLADNEYPRAAELALLLPDTCTGVAVTGLGKLGAAGDAWKVPTDLGAITAWAAPFGSTGSATGWQLGQHAAQIAPTVLLGRGAILRLTERKGTTLAGQELPQGMVPLADILRGQLAIETGLPLSTRVVGVFVDVEPGEVPQEDDFVIAADGGRLSEAPVRVEGGNHLMLLYDVLPILDKRERKRLLTITVGLKSGGRCAGVVGLSGTAQTWGQRMNGQIPERLVPDAPLTPDGEVLVRFAIDPQ